MSKYTLIICEKPSAAKKMAEALADKTAKKLTYMRRIPYYELTHNNNPIVIACAVGHLYTVAEKDKKGWKYPVFGMEWKASFEVSKGAAFTKPYLNLIKKLAKDAGDIVVACDFDVEGEVIGFNIIKYTCKRDDAQRMKFSTTTKEDLRKSFDERIKKLDLKQVEAGITRHELDWLFGINLSRALTLSLKTAIGGFKVLSSGRVQGPALKILSEKEKEIDAFVAEPYWELELIAKELNAWHKEGKFLDRKVVEEIHKRCENAKAIIDKITKKQFKQAPPFPFDLTALQIEVYRLFRISPKRTLEIAQSLYSNSYISYPRTSSNQYPESIEYKKLLQELSKQEKYKELAKDVLKFKTLKPNNGKKTDPAHPAIYVTGEIPKELDEQETKLYDLIAKRFMSTFAQAAVRETVKIEIDVNKETFIAKGTRTVEENWHKYYKPYVKLEEQEINVEEKQELTVENIKIHDKETQPPKRYTPASIIKELEKRNLGTKATRSEIIEHLFDRNYLRRGHSIEVTGLGMKAISVLDKYCPEILDSNLTKEFEEDMEKIREGKSTEEKTIKNAEKFLKKVLTQFKDNEVDIGKELSTSYKQTLKEENFVMKCPDCKGDLQIKYTPKFKSYFVACSSYPDCKKAFSLPRYFLARTSNKKCSECGFPEVTLIKKGKKPWAFCVNPECPKKEEYKKLMEAKKAEA
ncbi:DNA topoisomerase I [archaeon]|jgi:DNA topoisomerase I|nr:DNA topoisomerase I [archaeon]MBT3730390.1 DNA topoisomerase I [archaeon]MBT5030163.1 DNA topoisomerase I [archaeon]MBT5287718.1 DNA topoisomerase I [archaeon]MBT7053142.1 DNA topoisomerase I [archaeon]